MRRLCWHRGSIKDSLTELVGEEHGSASLQKRLDAARQLAAKGSVVGFHFHPMIHYQQWREDYAEIFQKIQQSFTPQQVAMISLGTLTFIKITPPAINKISNDKIPIRGLPDSTPTQPIMTGPIMAANLPSML